MTETGCRRPRHTSNAQRGLWATHLVLGADDGGGAAEGQTEDDDGERGQDVEDAVHLDRHEVIPF